MLFIALARLNLVQPGMSKSYTGLQVEDAIGQTPGVNDTTNYELQEEIDAFCTRFEINPAFKPRLNQLTDYEVVMIADDSAAWRSAPMRILKAS